MIGLSLQTILIKPSKTSNNNANSTKEETGSFLHMLKVNDCFANRAQMFLDMVLNYNIYEQMDTRYGLPLPATPTLGPPCTCCRCMTASLPSPMTAFTFSEQMDLRYDPPLFLMPALQVFG